MKLLALTAAAVLTATGAFALDMGSGNFPPAAFSSGGGTINQPQRMISGGCGTGCTLVPVNRSDGGAAHRRQSMADVKANNGPSSKKSRDAHGARSDGGRKGPQ
jgi:hypothetical protein